MFIIEFGPVGVFFLTFYLADFLIASLALGTATFVALIASKLVNKRVPWFAIFSGSVTILSALVTFLFTAPWILIIKDSVYYFLFAFMLGFSLWKRRSVLKTFFGHVFLIEEKGWRMLEKRWFVFFLFAGFSNELVRMFLTLDQWVLYKQLVLVVFLSFGLYQFRVSVKYRRPEADKWGLRKSISK